MQFARFLPFPPRRRVESAPAVASVLVAWQASWPRRAGSRRRLTRSARGDSASSSCTRTARSCARTRTPSQHRPPMPWCTGAAPSRPATPRARRASRGPRPARRAAKVCGGGAEGHRHAASRAAVEMPRARRRVASAGGAGTCRATPQRAAALRSAARPAPCALSPVSRRREQVAGLAKRLIGTGAAAHPSCW